jgi:hypothetical protein
MKYYNTPVDYDGHHFDSKAERDRYIELKLMQDIGAIEGLELQKPFRLCKGRWNNGRPFSISYKADFVYTLDGDVIVASGSFVGEGTRLKRTVVGLDTYIGTGLDFEDKIVIGNRVIDPATGVWMDMEEPGLARRIGGGFSWLRKLWHFLRGKSYGRAG